MVFPQFRGAYMACQAGRATQVDMSRANTLIAILLAVVSASAQQYGAYPFGPYAASGMSGKISLNFSQFGTTSYGSSFPYSGYGGAYDPYGMMPYSSYAGGYSPYMEYGGMGGMMPGYGDM
ncbi:unnamed protein product [Anisakis simplex]|uniref:Glycine rich superfamily member n=1 Tax=Anisakis simplex TaxID=6269 RepID=A0A0M3KFL6_ANISI|nr:unnamed protein product [Anisakis simplex]